MRIGHKIMENARRVYACVVFYYIKRISRKHYFAAARIYFNYYLKINTNDINICE